MKKRQADKIWKKIRYHIVGFTGVGQTAFDKNIIKRKRIAEPTERQIKRFAEVIEEVKKVRKGAFRQACIDVLGEDPETDWADNEDFYDEEMRRLQKGTV